MKIAVASDKFKKQVTHSHSRHYVIEHLPISLLRDDPAIKFVEEPGIFRLKITLESPLTPLKRPAFEPRCK